MSFLTLLMEEVKALVDAGILSRGRGKYLNLKLKRTRRRLDQGKTEAVVNRLNAFIRKVQGLIRTRFVSPEQGQPLIDAPNAIIDDINDL